MMTLSLAIRGSPFVETSPPCDSSAGRLLARFSAWRRGGSPRLPGSARHRTRTGGRISPDRPVESACSVCIASRDSAPPFHPRATWDFSFTRLPSAAPRVPGPGPGPRSPWITRACGQCAALLGGPFRSHPLTPAPRPHDHAARRRGRVLSSLQDRAVARRPGAGQRGP
jgi:hypothetical protein